MSRRQHHPGRCGACLAGEVTATPWPCLTARKQTQNALSEARRRCETAQAGGPRGPINEELCRIAVASEYVHGAAERAVCADGAGADVLLETSRLAMDLRELLGAYANLK